jgi:hypothetical protein
VQKGKFPSADVLALEMTGGNDGVVALVVVIGLRDLSLPSRSYRLLSQIGGIERRAWPFS